MTILFKNNLPIFDFFAILHRHSLLNFFTCFILCKMCTFFVFINGKSICYLSKAIIVSKCNSKLNFEYNRHISVSSVTEELPV